MSALSQPPFVRRIWDLSVVAALVAGLAGFWVLFISQSVPRASAASLNPSVRLNAILAGANGASAGAGHVNYQLTARRDTVQ